jgi:hypothetical protein
MYEVTIQAAGEVRDKDGNLLSSTPVEFEKQIITEEQAKALGLIEED